jgi:hypothetical protein
VWNMKFPCRASGSQSTAVPWLMQSVHCHTMLKQPVPCRAVAQAVSPLPFRGSGNQFIAVSCLRQPVHCRAVAQAASPLPCRGSGSHSSASYRGGSDWILSQSVWDLWWTKWRWDRLFFEVLRGSFAVLFYQYPTRIYLSPELCK